MRSFLDGTRNLHDFFGEALHNKVSSGVNVIIVVPDIATKEQLCFEIAKQLPLLNIGQMNLLERAGQLMGGVTMYGILYTIEVKGGEKR